MSKLIGYEKKDFEFLIRSIKKRKKEIKRLEKTEKSENRNFKIAAQNFFLLNLFSLIEKRFNKKIIENALLSD